MLMNRSTLRKRPLAGALGTLGTLAGGMMVAMLSVAPVGVLHAQSATCAAAWGSGTVYTQGNTASKNSVNYVANWWTQGDDPATHSGGAGSGQPWTTQGSCSGTGGGGTGGGGGSSSSGAICFYADANYGGDSFCADSDSSWVGTVWNDRVSSVKVKAGYQVVLSNDINYGGASLSLTGDTANLPASFNDKLSSFKVLQGDPTGGGGGNGGVFFSPYNDALISLNYNTNEMNTLVTGTRLPFVGAGSVVSTAVPNLGGISLGFATGECGSESWAGIPAKAFADANIGKLNSAGVDYVISTGGAAGSFSCGSPAGMAAFVDRYNSPHLKGVDFDIEGGQSQQVIDNLIAGAKYVSTLHPNLRFSFTVATLAASDGSYGGVNSLGDRVARSVKASGLSNATINLMAFDFGNPSPGVCVVSNGQCDMGQSAVQAVKNLQHTYGFGPGQIEVTTMIGQNDSPALKTYTADIDPIVSYAVANKLAAIHHWSFDRDTPCAGGATGYASPTCNSLNGTQPLEYTKRFLKDLGR